jgi:hypothetical protein
MMAGTQILTETDYAYLAGVIDGEGTITFSRIPTRRNGRVYCNYSPHLSISNTDLGMMKSLKRRFGGGLVRVAPPSNKLWKRGNILYFRREEMLTLLPKVTPYLTGKKRKAELLLEYMTTRTESVRQDKNGRYVGIPLTDRQRKIISEIRKRNRRGPPI